MNDMTEGDFVLTALRDGARPSRVSAVDAMDRAEGMERRLNKVIVVAVVFAVLAVSGHARAVKLADTLEGKASFREDVRTVRGPAMPWARRAAVTRLRQEIAAALAAIEAAELDGDVALSDAAIEASRTIRAR